MHTALLARLTIRGSCRKELRRVLLAGGDLNHSPVLITRNLLILLAAKVNKDTIEGLTVHGQYTAGLNGASIFSVPASTRRVGYAACAACHV